MNSLAIIFFPPLVYFIDRCTRVIGAIYAHWNWTETDNIHESALLLIFLDSLLMLKSKFYKVLSNRADESHLFSIWQDFLVPFLMNHALQFIKYQQRHKTNETPASSRWFCCYSQLHNPCHRPIIFFLWTSVSNHNFNVGETFYQIAAKRGKPSKFGKSIQVVCRLLTTLLWTGNSRFAVVNCEGKPPDNETNTFIDRLESNGKF